MSEMFGCEDWECELVLEDNTTLNRIMAEPKGTARHLVAEDGKYSRVSQWQTLRENLQLATAAAIIAAASEEVARCEEDTVSQWQTCLESDGVDRDYQKLRVMPMDGSFCCGAQLHAKESPPLDPQPSNPTNHHATGDARNRLFDAARIDREPCHTAAGTPIPEPACKFTDSKPTAARQTELQMNGDDNHGSCLKNLNQEQVVECSPDPISMVQMVVQMEATIGTMLKIPIPAA